MYTELDEPAQVDGPAFDSFATASRALWTKALIDEEVGIAASYLDDEDFAKIMRYADNMEREKMAFKPLGERLFAIKDHKFTRWKACYDDSYKY